MKKIIKFLCFCLSMSVLISTVSFAAKRSSNSLASGHERTPAIKETPKKDKESLKVEKKNLKAAKHEIKEKLMDAKKNKSNVDPIILILLAIFLPPVAVYLLEGLSTYFWIDLILTLLFFLPGMIFALYLVLKSQGSI
jgi:uncharacterized membrane protein YqaE (UPF0057 family)